MLLKKKKKSIENALELKEKEVIRLKAEIKEVTKVVVENHTKRVSELEDENNKLKQRIRALEDELNKLRDFKKAEIEQAKAAKQFLELKPYIGCEYIPNPNAKTGVLVQSVARQSPASRSGLKIGDVIEKVEDKPVESKDSFRRAIDAFKPGDPVHFWIRRNGELYFLTIEIGSFGVSQELIAKLKRAAMAQAREMNGHSRPQSVALGGPDISDLNVNFKTYEELKGINKGGDDKKDDPNNNSNGSSGLKPMASSSLTVDEDSSVPSSSSTSTSPLNATKPTS